MKKCKIIFEQMIEKHKQCHEAYFGLGKLLLHLGDTDKAVLMIERSIKAMKVNGQIPDVIVLIWAAFGCYIQMRKMKPLHLKVTFAKKIQLYALEALDSHGV